MKVVNRYKEKFTVNIMRPTIFGNPFVIGRDGTRDEVVAKYEAMTRDKHHNELWFAIYDLPEDAVLGCCCAPRACHGNAIVKLWKEMHQDRPTKGEQTCK